MNKRWFVKNKKANLKLISSEFKISQFLSRLIINRDINTYKNIQKFINPVYENLNNPRKMKDIEKGVEIIKYEIKNKNKISIIGDYDVDGVVSTFVLYSALKRCGANVMYQIPNRIKDGYGINKNMVDFAKDNGVKTIITCDNGISAFEAIEHAKNLGINVIVTDHHDIPFYIDENNKKIYNKLKADAIINPKQLDDEYEFKKLCGAGVVFKFVQVLYEEMGINKDEAYDFIQYVAIATVCDVVDLIDENRIIVKNGLELLSNTKNLGLKELINITKINDKKISTYHLGFIIGPCINASGRLDSAFKGVELLLTNDIQKAKNLASLLYDLNTERKDMTQKGVEKAQEYIKQNKLQNDKVLVIYIEETHESIVGIIAGRIKEIYNIPTIVLTDGEQYIKGSGRSIENYNMFEELNRCKDILKNFGGHPMAAGLSIEKHNIENLRKRLNENSKLTQEDIVPKICFDMSFPLEDVNFDIIKDLNVLEPFGKANPKPLFGEKSVIFQSASILGKNKNVLKLKSILKNRKYIEALYFGDIKEFENLIIEKFGENSLKNLYSGNGKINLDIAYFPQINEYNGNTTIQLVIEDFR